MPPRSGTDSFFNILLFLSFDDSHFNKLFAQIRRKVVMVNCMGLFFGGGVWSVGSLRCTSIDTPYQRVRKLKVLIAIKGELDQYPEQGSIATDLANDQIE